MLRLTYRLWRKKEDISKRLGEEAWEEQQALFNADGPVKRPQMKSSNEVTQLRGKFFVTFAYPYMNGVLHVGYSFTLSKVESATQFARMQGMQP